MTPSADMFQELQWLPFPKRMQYHTQIMMFKALNGIAPDYLSNMFLKISDSHVLNLRSAEKSPLQNRAYLSNLDYHLISIRLKVQLRHTY